MEIYKSYRIPKQLLDIFGKNRLYKLLDMTKAKDKKDVIFLLKTGMNNCYDTIRQDEKEIYKTKLKSIKRKLSVELTYAIKETEFIPNRKW